MADTPENTPPELSKDVPSEQAPLDLVPSFAPEEGKEESWTQLTTVNSDYERLWSMPNGSSAHDASPPEESNTVETPPVTPPEPVSPPEADTPPPSEPPPPVVATPGFTGTLVTGSEVLNASIIVGSAGIVLWGGGAEIGTWEHSQAKVARLTFSRFAIQAEGETLTFTADDPTGLDNAIAAAMKTEEDPGRATPEDSPPVLAVANETPPELVSDPATSAATPGSEPEKADVQTSTAAPVRRPRIKNFRPEGAEVSGTLPTALDSIEPASSADPGPEAEEAGDEFTIADSVRATSDRKTVKPRRFLPSDFRGILIKAAVVLGLIAVLAGATYAVLLLMGRTGEGATPTTQPEATAPPITIVITTTPPVTTATTVLNSLPNTTLFQTDAATLTERWNSLAEVSAPNMVLFSDLTSPFILLLTPNVTLEGVLDPVAGNVTMRATPTGTPEGDGAILSALGILIGTADPTLDGADRRALLGRLGLDVDRPELGGINGTLTHNGLTYRMVYQAEPNTLEFAITPEGAVTTTTASG
jgi:hypothetical protein